jgi:uncharacterized repeat protein (TIGR02543 family)
MNDGLTDLDVFSLAVDPVVPSTLYAGTADGVFRSVNSGAVWTAANVGLADENVLALAIDPRTPTALYAGTWGDGIFRSWDSGATWTPVAYGATSLWVGSLVIDPVVPSTLYAGTAEGVFRSVDGGTMWAGASSGLTDLGIRSLVIDPLTPATLYAGTDSGGVWSSTNSGVTWHAMNTGLTNLSAQSLAIAPYAASTVYVGTWGSGIFRSVDGGATWSTMNEGLANLDVQCLAVDPLIPGTLYAGTFYGGVFRYDAGSSYALTTTASPAGGGSIARSPDAAWYAPGTVVTLLATPSSGYHFVSWSGALMGTANPTTITMDGSKTVTATFSPDPPSLTLTFPNGTESWVPGAVQNVTWTVTGDTSAIHHFSLYYTVDGGNSWERAGGGFAGSADRTFAWTVPARFSSRAKVIAYAMDAASQLLAYDASDAFFTIAPEGAGTLPGVSLIHPSAESWMAGTTQMVTWSVTGSLSPSFHHFSVYASLEDGRNGSWFNVGFSPVPSLSWDIPAAFGSAHARVVVYAMDATSHLLSDAFPATFAITPATGAFDMSLTAPAGGATLHVGALTSVTWTTSGTLPPQVSSYKVWYSVDGTLSWELAGSTPSSPYSWTVPSRLSPTCTVMVVALDASTKVLAVATSSTFTIAP